jgi:hypothetical protein
MQPKDPPVSSSLPLPVPAGSGDRQSGDDGTVLRVQSIKTEFVTRGAVRLG